MKHFKKLCMYAYERQRETWKFKANPADVILVIQVGISIYTFLI